MAPSLLVLASSDELNKSISNAVYHFTSQSRLSDTFKDISYLLVCSLFQGYYHFYTSSSLSEHYWGLMRIFPSNQDESRRQLQLQKLLGFLETVLTPFINRKLVELNKQLYYHDINLNDLEEAAARLYPRVNLGVTTANIIVKLAYYLKLTSKYAITSHLMGVEYSVQNDFTVKSANPAHYAMQTLFPLSMFSIKLLKQWQGSEISSYKADVNQPPSTQYLYHNSAAECDTCSLCNRNFITPTAIPTTGNVFCYICIFNHIQKEGNCPSSNLPLKTSDLVRLNLT